jgi:hypothetical protein
LELCTYRRHVISRDQTLIYLQLSSLLHRAIILRPRTFRLYRLRHEETSLYVTIHSIPPQSHLLYIKSNTQSAITEKNNLWAHNEAHASTFTACLPTLRPLFQDNRSVHSLIGSVRSLLSINSNKSTENDGKSQSDASSSNSSKEKLSHDDWCRMHAKGATTDIEAVPRSEQGSVQSDSILVKTNFGAQEV